MVVRAEKAFESILPDSLKLNVTPVEIKEIIYQAVAYLGIGRVADFFRGLQMIVFKSFEYQNCHLKHNQQLQDRLD